MEGIWRGTRDRRRFILEGSSGKLGFSRVFLGAESARGKMTQHLSLFCGRLGTGGAAGVQPWGAPQGSVLAPSAPEAADARYQQAVTVPKLQGPV